jgi:hypothetical protein
MLQLTAPPLKPGPVGPGLGPVRAMLDAPSRVAVDDLLCFIGLQ